MFDRSGVLVSTLHGLIEKIIPRVIALRNQTGEQIDEQSQHHRQQRHWLGGQIDQHQPGKPQQQYRSEETQRYQSKEDWADMIAKVTEEQFGIKPKDQTSVYRPPYPEWFDRVPLPGRYKIPDFFQFSGQDDISTREHISRFLA